MAVDHIRYDILAQDALRGVVRSVLRDAAKHGSARRASLLHFVRYAADGVRLSPRMLAQYPQEMTIVLQHQFWDLNVTEDGFEVGLSFGGTPERLCIPFAAIKGFFDPSVEFGLQFEEASVDASPKPADKSAQTAVSQSARRTRSAAEPKPAAAGLPAVPAPANPEEAGSSALPTDAKPEGSAEVVRLDRFRKK